MILPVYRKFELFLYYQGAQAEPPKAKVREVKANLTQWNQEQLQLLIKGVNLYPPGTADRLVICNSSHSIQAESPRWNTIANYINTHIHSDRKTGTMVVTMVKKLQKLGG